MVSTYNLILIILRFAFNTAEIYRCIGTSVSVISRKVVARKDNLLEHESMPYRVFTMYRELKYNI